MAAAHIAVNPAAGPLTDAEKAKRKTARANNKLWVAATDVRIGFIQQLLQRKELPAGWIPVVARYIASQNVVDYRARNTVESFLGISDETRVSQWLEQNPTRASHLCLAAALAAIESQYEYDKKGWDDPYSPAHLQQLAAWGYTLSDIEQLTAGTVEVTPR